MDEENYQVYLICFLLSLHPCVNHCVLIPASTPLPLLHYTINLLIRYYWTNAYHIRICSKVYVYVVSELTLHACFQTVPDLHREGHPCRAHLWHPRGTSSPLHHHGSAHRPLPPMYCRPCHRALPLRYRAQPQLTWGWRWPLQGWDGDAQVSMKGFRVLR